jgi:pSer/pThr/pTyr-binding forkhead associated (FHA) protein
MTRTEMPTRPLFPSALEINNQCLKLSVGNNIVGRASEPGDPQPDIALDPFGAQEKGVSRRHILINRTEGSISVMDLSSTNGTWLNGECLTPGTEYPLRGSDKLRLGRLELTAEYDELLSGERVEPGPG